MLSSLRAVQFNRTLGCFDDRNDEGSWQTTTQATLEAVVGEPQESPLEAWRKAGKPTLKEQEVVKKAFTKQITTDQYGDRVERESQQPQAAAPREEATVATEPLSAATDRTHHRPAQHTPPQASATARPGTSQGMRQRYNEWEPKERPQTQGRAAGMPLSRNVGQGELNMFLPMPPRRG